MLDLLDVSVEHRAGAAASHLVPGAVDLEPFRGSLLAPAQFLTHARIKNLRAAAGERAEAGFAQDGKRFGD